MSDARFSDVYELFMSLAFADYAEFLARCAEELTVVMRDSLGSTVLGRDDVTGWFEERYRASGATLQSAVSSVSTDGPRAVVVLSHALRRDGRGWQYDTINVCELDGGRLRRWVGSPADLAEHAQAWGLAAGSRLLPA